jgi:hypothetical protein
VDVYQLANDVTVAGLEKMTVPPCRDDGLRRQRSGEAREADLGVASGNGRGQIFVSG